MAVDVNWQSVLIGAVPSSVAGVFAWLTARANGKKDVVSGQAALLKALQDGAIEQMSALRAEIAELRSDATEDRARIAALEQELAREKVARTDERHRLASAATNAQAEARRAARRADAAEHELEVAAGERRQLMQIIDSLTRRLRELGVDVPLPAPRATEPILLGAPADA